MKLISLMKGCLAAAAISAIASTASAQPLQKVTVALAGQSMIASIPRVAQEMGLFKKRGLEVNFITMESANAAATALISGSIDFAFSGPVELITGRARGRDIVAIANTYGGLGGTLVLSKKAAASLKVTANAPISERLKALNGMMIASPSATSAFTVSYKNAAAAVGSNVRFTYMAMPAMAAALDSGAIQGYVASAPFWVTPVTGGTGIMWINGPKGELPAALRPKSNSVLLAMRSTTKAKPELVQGLTGVFADFIQAIDQRPAEVKAAVAKVFPSVSPRDLDLLFETESLAWKAKPLTAQDIAHEIAYTKLSGARMPQLDTLPPAEMILP
jgi:ABC-type nitrate/sulfonate/bicarbonate transport system substrate-binding protein